ncbi:MAG: Ppx/GppA family phosphatase [Bacteroidales bacterium]|nr:Ppx/GppA family phosphatase [Bacteroidales bacterium]
MDKDFKFNLAAIDIGSNGARFLIKEFAPIEGNDEYEARVKKILFLRFPLRLGKDVFSLGKISKRRQEMIIHFIKGCKQFMLLNRVLTYRACATSAMRDAENGKNVIHKIQKQTGVNLQIIGGDEEAKILCNHLVENLMFSKGNIAFIDVGGGSTEVSIIHDRQLAESHSYNIGTLRLLSDKVEASEQKLFEKNLTRYAELYPNIKIVGSGGNINKLNKLCRHSKGDNEISVEEIHTLYNELKDMSVEQRIEKYHLKDDRADVIVPAANVFLYAAHYLKADSVYVPNISLADCIVDGLYRRLFKK